MKNVLIILGLATVAFTSCSKKADVACLSGSGGDLMVQVIPKYNGNALISRDTEAVTVYIAYGDVEFPGPGEKNYNKTVVGKNNNPFVNCHNLKCGLYYFYATFTNNANGEVYSGGAPLNTDQHDGSLELTIDMTKE